MLVLMLLFMRLLFDGADVDVHVDVDVDDGVDDAVAVNYDDSDSDVVDAGAVVDDGKYDGVDMDVDVDADVDLLSRSM